LRIFVIFNPIAGRLHRRRLNRTIAYLRAGGCMVTLFETQEADDVERMAHRAGSEPYDIIVAAGGDGTMNGVANGLASLAAPPPMGLIPLGTANVLAAEIGLPTTARAAARALMAGKRRTIRLGSVNGRHFVLMASAGLDAEVVAGLNLALKQRVGRLAYVWESLVRAVRYCFPSLSIVADGHRYEARMAVVCKGRCYGGPFVAAHAGRLDDPILHLILLRGGGLFNTLRYGLALAMGTIETLADVKIVPVRHATIGGTAGAPVQADGDLVTRLPAEIGLSPRSLELIVP
jgi:YegS/Rv2252/BmrU family lipid kinase